MLYALGNDQQDRANLCALNMAPFTLAGIVTLPNLYRMSLTTAQNHKFLFISGISNSPVAVTATPLPATQDIGAMFSDRQGGTYA